MRYLVSLDNYVVVEAESEDEAVALAPLAIIDYLRPRLPRQVGWGGCCGTAGCPEDVPDVGQERLWHPATPSRVCYTERRR